MKRRREAHRDATDFQNKTILTHAGPYSCLPGFKTNRTTKSTNILKDYTSLRSYTKLIAYFCLVTQPNFQTNLGATHYSFDYNVLACCLINSVVIHTKWNDFFSPGLSIIVLF